MPRFVAATASLAGIVTAVAFATPALADGPSVLYAADKAIWRAESSGKAKAVEAISLDVDADKVTRIETRKGSPFVLLQVGKVTAFAKLGKKSVEPEPLDCASHARLSPDGLCVACLDREGRLVVHILASGKTRKLGKLTPSDFDFASRSQLAVVEKSSISIVSIAKAKREQKVAGFAPTSHLLVSPNGERAVAAFENGDGTTLFGFKLDGKAAKRKLASNGYPSRWSRDGKWVVTQNGDRTCVVRATGGQYKCWNGYTGLALSPDDKEFLLSQKSGHKHKLFKVTMAGARPATPVQWKTADAAAASWMD